MRAQAALEFLTTYGWAFIVILTAIGALTYFGVLTPEPPSKCMVSPEFVCQDYQIIRDDANNQARVNLVLANSQEFRMEILGGECRFSQDSTEDIYIYELGDLGGTSAMTDWTPGEKRYYQCVTTGIPNEVNKGDKTKVFYSITYRNQDITDSFSHTVEGEAIAEVVEP